MLILNRRVVYVVCDASTTPKCWFVMISADNKALKVWHMLGTRRWTRNGALAKGGSDKCPCCLQRWKQYIIPMLYKAERPCFFVFLCMFYMLATYTVKVLQVCYHFKGRIFHASSQPAWMWKEDTQTDRKQLFIRTHSHSTSSCLYHFQDNRAIHICLPYTQIPKKNTHSSSTERGLLLSHMLSHADTAISI